MAAEIDAAFTALPLRQLADAALTRLASSAPSTPTSASSASATSTCACATRGSTAPQDGEDLGFAVRVVHDGSWGFASGVDLTPEAAARVAEQAVAVARLSRPLSTERVELADEPVHADVTWVSPYDVDPFDRGRPGEGRRCWPSGAPAAGARRRRPRRRDAARTC